MLKIRSAWCTGCSTLAKAGVTNKITRTTPQPRNPSEILVRVCFTQGE
jgi:hypothetical protein